MTTQRVPVAKTKKSKKPRKIIVQRVVVVRPCTCSSPWLFDGRDGRHCSRCGHDRERQVAA
jgi:hypothetical protein